MDAVDGFVGACVRLYQGGTEVMSDEKTTAIERAVERMGQVADAAYERAMEQAEQRVTLAAYVSSVKANTEAFGAVLDSSAKLRADLEVKLKTAAGPLKKLYQRQLEDLGRHEEEVLRRATSSPQRLLGQKSSVEEGAVSAQ